jgi:two-component system cell cycle sensor histidine kinase/response regulator CckA
MADVSPLSTNQTDDPEFDPRKGARRPTILVVDDQPELVALLQRMLEVDGYETLTATSGTEALNLCASSPRRVDLLLTDLHMPGMTGRMLATALRNTQLGMKVLYLTGHSDDLFGSLTLLEPHEAFLEKPITAGALREGVSLHLYSMLTPPTRSAAKESADAHASGAKMRAGEDR